ncbi:hypothetical protein ACFWN7_08885 [Agromyces sp. NPDC058484]
MAIHYAEIRRSLDLAPGLDRLHLHGVGRDQTAGRTSLGRDVLPGLRA